jgi:hypothetical protein
MMDMVVAVKSRAAGATFLHSSPDPADQRETTTVVPTETR